MKLLLANLTLTMEVHYIMSNEKKHIAAQTGTRSCECGWPNRQRDSVAVATKKTNNTRRETGRDSEVHMLKLSIKNVIEWEQLAFCLQK